MTNILQLPRPRASAGTSDGAQVVRFPKHRIVRTKTRCVQIQRAYRHTNASESPAERFRRAEFAVQFAADFDRSNRK